MSRRIQLIPCMARQHDLTQWTWWTGEDLATVGQHYFLIKEFNKGNTYMSSLRPLNIHSQGIT